MAAKQIDQYAVMYSANSFYPRIWLKGGGKFIGQLNFLANGVALPPDGLSGGMPNLFYHLDNFPHVLDLLRNEKPTYINYLGSGGGFENSIMTSDEPQGEGE
ncbi:MAG TPA: hypothetical protein VJN96_22945 [Vicinamibacterales bacterium]|nr:hypothetical protein [Vicinamibacterales bacterium]